MPSLTNYRSFNSEVEKLALKPVTYLRAAAKRLNVSNVTPGNYKGFKKGLKSADIGIKKLEKTKPGIMDKAMSAVGMKSQSMKQHEEAMSYVGGLKKAS